MAAAAAWMSSTANFSFQLQLIHFYISTYWHSLQFLEPSSVLLFLGTALLFLSLLILLTLFPARVSVVPVPWPLFSHSL